MAVADTTRVDFGKVYTPNELESTLNNLSDVDKLKLCEGELFISSDSDIYSFLVFFVKLQKILHQIKTRPLH